MVKPKGISINPANHNLIKVEGGVVDVCKISDELYLKALTMGIQVLHARGELPSKAYVKA